MALCSYNISVVGRTYRTETFLYVSEPRQDSVELRKNRGRRHEKPLQHSQTSPADVTCYKENNEELQEINKSNDMYNTNDLTYMVDDNKDKHKSFKYLGNKCCIFL